MRCKSINFLIAIPVSLTDNVLDLLACGIMEFWKSKNRPPLPIELRQSHVLAHLLNFIPLVSDFHDQIHTIPYIFSKSSIIAPVIAGPDIAELARVCRELFHNVDIQQFEPRIKAIWKRNIKNLSESQLSVMMHLLQSNQYQT